MNPIDSDRQSFYDKLTGAVTGTIMEEIGIGPAIVFFIESE